MKVKWGLVIGAGALATTGFVLGYKYFSEPTTLSKDTSVGGDVSLSTYCSSESSRIVNFCEDARDTDLDGDSDVANGRDNCGGSKLSCESTCQDIDACYYAAATTITPLAELAPPDSDDSCSIDGIRFDRPKSLEILLGLDDGSCDCQVCDGYLGKSGDYEFWRTTPEGDCCDASGGTVSMLINQIKQATTVRAALYELSCNDISAALAAKGSAVTLITDDDHYHHPELDKGCGVSEVETAGGKVVPVESSGIMHQKFFIFDDRLVSNGSQNISSGGLGWHHENRFNVSNSDIVQAYIKEFEQYENRCGSQCTPSKVQDLNDEDFGSTYLAFSPSDTRNENERGYMRRVRGEASDCPASGCPDSCVLENPCEDGETCWCMPYEKPCTCTQNDIDDGADCILDGPNDAKCKAASCDRGTCDPQSLVCTKPSYSCSYCNFSGQSLLEKATNRIYASWFFMTDACIAVTIRHAHARGVDVKIVWDANGAENAYSMDDYLCDKIKADSGTFPNLKIETWYGKNHNKYIVIDDVLMVGTANPSKNSCDSNEETTHIINDKSMADAYAGYVESEFNSLTIPVCTKVRPESPESAGTCSDGQDNDYDGLVDGDDPGCK